MGEIIENGHSWLLLLSTLLYVALIQLLSRRQSQPRPLTDAEMLAKLALLGQVSEYDIFKSAAGDWHVPERQVEPDFKTYLTQGLIPYYVNAYVRRRGRELGGDFSPPFSLDGRNSMPWLR